MIHCCTLSSLSSPNFSKWLSLLFGLALFYAYPGAYTLGGSISAGISAALLSIGFYYCYPFYHSPLIKGIIAGSLGIGSWIIFVFLGKDGLVFAWSLPLGIPIVWFLTVSKILDWQKKDKVLTFPSFWEGSWVIFFLWVVVVATVRWNHSMEIYLPTLLTILVAFFVSFYKIPEHTYPYIFFLLFMYWLLTVVNSLMQIWTGTPLGGIQGNPNWVAASIVTTVWGALHFLKACVTQWKQTIARHFVLCHILYYGGLGGIGITSLIVLSYCQSRAAWLGLGIWIFIRFGNQILTWKRGKWILSFACILLISIGVYFLMSHYLWIKAEIQSEIRIPLWIGSCYIAFRAWSYGLSLPEAGKAFSEFLLHTGTPWQLTEAVVFDHPHHEYLFYFVYFGLPGLILFVLSTFPCFCGKWLGERYTLSPEESVIRRATLFCLFMGLWDKSLMVFPLNLLWGLLWGMSYSSFLQKQPHIEKCLYLPSSSIIRIGKLAWIGLIGIGSWYYLQYSRSQWYYRNGLVFNHRQHPVFAYQAFQNSLSIIPKHLPTVYTAATLGVNQLTNLSSSEAIYFQHQVQHIEQQLQTIYEMNPYYLHINRLLGRFYGFFQEHPKALYFFQQDLKLYPQSILSHQWYFYSLIANNVEISELTDAWEAMLKAMGKRIESEADRRKLPHLPVSWMKAVEAENWEQSIAIATELIQSISFHSWIELNLDSLVHPQRYPQNWMGDHFHLADIPFWKSMIFREKLRERLHSTYHHDPLGTLRYVFENYEPRFDRTFLWPYQFETQNHASSESLIFLIDWLETRPIIVLKTGSTPRMIAIFDESLPFLIIADIFQKKIILIHSQNELQTFLDKYKQIEYLLPVFPHEWLARHWFLEGLIHRYYRSYRPHLDLVDYPHLRWKKVLTWMNRNQIKLPIENSSPSPWIFPYFETSSQPSSSSSP